MGPGEGTSAEGSEQDSIGGCPVLPAPIVLLLLGVSLHSSLPSSPAERCTSVMSTLTSA